MSNDTKFINGLIVKAPNERAPEYIKARYRKGAACYALT